MQNKITAFLKGEACSIVNTLEPMAFIPFPLYCNDIVILYFSDLLYLINNH